VRRGREAASVDRISITPEEYPRYLRKAYAEEDFPKPRNAVGLPAELPVKEMENLVMKSIEIRDSDLRLVALNRSQRVLDAPGDRADRWTRPGSSSWRQDRPDTPPEDPGTEAPCPQSSDRTREDGQGRAEAGGSRGL
jgi:hypothetical protein